MNRTIRALFVLCLVAVLALQVEFRAIFSHLNADLLWALAASQPFIALSFVAFAVRLRAILPSIALPADSAFNAVVLPVGLNAVLPARLSEFVKPVYLWRKARLPLQDGITCLLMERMFDVIVIGLLSAVVLPALLIPQPPTYLFIVVAAAAVLIPLAFSRLFRRHPGWFSRLPAFLRRQLESLSAIQQPRRYLWLMALSSAGWMCSALSVHVCLRIAGSIQIRLFESFSIFILTLIGGMIAILPAGVGTYQAVALVGLIALGFSAEEGLILGILLQISSLLFASLTSLILLAMGDFSMRDIGHVSLRSSG